MLIQFLACITCMALWLGYLRPGSLLALDGERKSAGKDIALTLLSCASSQRLQCGTFSLK